MKKILIYSFFAVASLITFNACKDDGYGNYPGGEVSTFIPALDLRSLYKGSDVNLTADVLGGSTSLAGVVISDHSGKNLPSGLLFVQDRRRLNELRGIALAIGSDAANYVPGDSVNINIVGGTLKRVDGLLQITGVPTSSIQKVASNRPFVSNRVPASYILANPDKYESTLLSIVKGTYNPTLATNETISGNKTLNDGFEDLTLHTEASATFSNTVPPYIGNYLGIMIPSVNSAGKSVPQHRLRRASDITPINTTIIIPDFVISGIMNDPEGTDANNEYIQFRATKDINFATKPFSVVTTNNAGASTPTGYPVNGWATGDIRTYKFNITSGTVSKGEFFYVGGTGKVIAGPAVPSRGLPASTSIASSKWPRSFNYSTTNGDGFGTKTSNLLANSGNMYGVAVFEGTTVNVNSTPIDAIFIGAGGTIFTAGPPAQGYRIPNSDLYDIIDPIGLVPQPFYRQGTNTINFSYWATADVSMYVKLGGVFDTKLGKWTKARTQTFVQLNKASQLNEIEGVFPAPTEDNPNGVPATEIK